jgi:hypothetical protein
MSIHGDVIDRLLPTSLLLAWWLRLLLLLLLLLLLTAHDRASSRR